MLFRSQIDAVGGKAEGQRIAHAVPQRGAGPIEYNALDADTLTPCLWPDHRLTEAIGEDLEAGLPRQQSDVHIGAGGL